MTPQETLAKAKEIVHNARQRGLLSAADYADLNFLQYAQLVVDIIKAWKPSTRERRPWLKEFIPALKELRDDFERIVAADPMCLYTPANWASEEFHSSKARIRYFQAGNRTSKTQSGYAEHYLITTGSHKWRDFDPPPASTAVIGLSYSKYAAKVFETKLVTGEDGNPLSPMFPPGGKWFYHYDERKKILQIACPKCANAGKGSSCSHPKSTITLFSDEGGVDVFMGAQYRMVHFDEHIREEFFDEAMQRIKTVRGGCVILTGTPLHGEEAWEIRRVQKIFDEGGPENRVDPEDPESDPYVSVHRIDQFEAGLVPHQLIKADMKLMDPFEIESRVYGKPAPLAKNPVFNRTKLAEMRENAYDPKRGQLITEDDILLDEVTDLTEFTFQESETGPYRLWEAPENGAYYIIGVDTAKGLYEGTDKKQGDYSAASVFKVTKSGVGVGLQMVAQYHGHINPHAYAEEVFKLCVWYNSALAVIELTGGYGEAVMLRMREEFHYWNFYKDRSMSHATAQFNPGYRLGVDTNKRTKPYMVAALQQFINDSAINIPCRATIQEMVAFEQERSDSGLSVRYRGVGGAHDDRVMSVVIAAAVALEPGVYSTFEAIGDHKTVSPSTQYTGEWRSIHEELESLDDDIDPFH